MGVGGVVTKLERGDPDNKCEIKIFVSEGHLEETRLRLKMRNLLTPQPIESMVWWDSSSQAAFLQIWVQRIQENDPVGLQLGNGDVWLYIILKLAERINRGNGIGEEAKCFKPRQVRDLHFGYVWGHGGKEQYQELRSGSLAEIMADGSQWWPVIWVEVVGDLLPVHCPGLAWAKGRPWRAHRSRLRREVQAPGVVIEELDSSARIVDVTAPRSQFVDR